MEWDISAECVSVIMLNIIMVYSWKGNLLPSRKNQAFRACLLITYLSILTNILSTLLLAQLSPSTILINQVLLHLNYISTPLMGVVYFIYTLTTVFEQDPDKLKKHILFAGIPALLYLLCLLSNPLTHLLFTLDLAVGYERGPWVSLTYIVFYIYVLFSVFFTISKRRNLDSAVFIILNFFPVLSAAVILFQLLYPNYILTGTAATSALLIIYLYLQNKQLFTDPLTGILNRQEFNRLLEIRMKDTASYSIIVLSLKGFRFINDHFSQKAGDVLLMRICSYLEKQQPTARVFRFSGDEFAIVCEDAETCRQYHEQLIARMQRSWSVENFDFQIQYGIGILHVEEHNRDKDEIIKGLEYAVMLAKRSEDNKTCVCTADMMERLHRNERILELLRRCIQ
ncbi:MAG: diguanylate cyclase domain-containing protein, partial [[Clostridium] innocuum]